MGHAKKQYKFARFAIRFVNVLGIALLLVLFFQNNNFAQLNPKGPIAKAQFDLIVWSISILLSVAIPTLALLYFIAWKYRESNLNATHDPEQKHGKGLVFTMWAIPSFFMLILALIMYPATHRLEPRQAIASSNPTLHVQVIAMRWKWIFIYPEQNIATVNYLQIPTNTPVQFDLTADEAPMSSFWIPSLGGQLYAMTGHSNRLNLMAEKSGIYSGSSAEINGAGFAEMKFTAAASSDAEFNNWIKDVKMGTNILDSGKYNDLLKPSEGNPAAYYSAVDPDLFYNLLAKYNNGHSHGGHE